MKIVEEVPSTYVVELSEDELYFLRAATKGIAPRDLSFVHPTKKNWNWPGLNVGDIDNYRELIDGINNAVDSVLPKPKW
jgi:hypothetical protein